MEINHGDHLKVPNSGVSAIKAELSIKEQLETFVDTLIDIFLYKEVDTQITHKPNAASKLTDKVR
jgi:hypothetical protein